MKPINFLGLAVLAGSGMLLASAPAAFAAIDTDGWTYPINDPPGTVTYDFSFTGNNGMDATGTFTVDGGVAISGSISATGVPIEADPSSTISSSGSLVADPGAPSSLTLIDHDGDDIIIDDIVNLPGSPILDGDGLGFASGQYQDSVHYNTLINLWGNSDGSYTLFVAEAQLDSNGNVIGDPQWVYAGEDGSLTFAPVPETSLWLNPLIIGALAMGCLAIRHRRVLA